MRFFRGAHFSPDGDRIRRPPTWSYRNNSIVRVIPHHRDENFHCAERNKYVKKTGGKKNPTEWKESYVLIVLIIRIVIIIVFAAGNCTGNYRNKSRMGRGEISFRNIRFASVIFRLAFRQNFRIKNAVRNVPVVLTIFPDRGKNI